MRVLVIGSTRSPTELADARLAALPAVEVVRAQRLGAGMPSDLSDIQAAVVWHEVLESVDRGFLRDYTVLSRHMPIIALMSLADWTGGRPGALLADGWVFLDCDLHLLPWIVRLARTGYWTAPDELVGPKREGLRRRQALRALSVEQLQVLDQLACGYSNRDIACRLRMPEAMVKKAVHDIITRLGLSNRTQAAVMALTVQLREPTSEHRTLPG